MNTHIDKLINNIKPNKDWQIHYSDENANELHLVITREYEPRIKRLLKKSDDKETRCWIGIHCHDNPEIGKYNLYADAVTSDLKTKKERSGLEAFKRKYYKPIDVLFNEFHLNPELMKIFDKNGNDISSDFLENAYKIHIKTTHLFFGSPIRFKLWFSRTFLSGIFNAISKILRFILFIFYGEKYKEKTAEDINFNYMYYQKVEIEKIDSDNKIKFHDIEVNYFSAASYCFIHVFAAFLYKTFGFHIQFVSTILGSTFLSLAYIVFSLFIWDHILPRLFHKSVLSSCKSHSYFKNSSLRV